MILKAFFWISAHIYILCYTWQLSIKKIKSFFLWPYSLKRIQQDWPNPISDFGLQTYIHLPIILGVSDNYQIQSTSKGLLRLPFSSLHFLHTVPPDFLVPLSYYPEGQMPLVSPYSCYPTIMWRRDCHICNKLAWEKGHRKLDFSQKNWLFARSNITS